MNKETYIALKKIIKDAKENTLFHIMHQREIFQVETWIEEVEKDYK